MSNNVNFMRTIHFFVRDRKNRPIPGARIEFTKDGTPAGGVPNSEGRGEILLQDRTSVVTVAATYQGETQKAQLAQAQDAFTFNFDTDVQPEFMEKHIALIVGLVLFAVGIALAFIFGAPTPLQTRIILGTFSLGGGAIATEISGMVKVDIKLGTALAIGATGALAIFVILYMVVPS
jgi:hypothetical protein